MNVSIAIPTYNRGEILVETIERLLAQEPSAAQIIVVDQTKAYPPWIQTKLEEHARENRISWIRLSEPSIPHAMNEALRAARSKIVLFLDDDVVPSAHLAAAHERAYEPGIWAVVGQVLQPGEEVVHADERTIHDGAIRDIEFPFNHDVPVDVENVIACNLSVDRERALAIGGFDENFLAAAYRFESDFAKRVVAAGGRVRFDPRAPIRHLKIPTGGVRAHGDHRTTANPTHSAGDYYFALHHVPAFWRYALTRFVRNVFTRFHLRHPWAIPSKVSSEIRGFLLARKLAGRGRSLLN
jgi:GT2 family glycosyltransferase